MWNNWRFETIDGIEYLISPAGRRFTERELEKEYYNQSELAEVLGVTRGAIQGRLSRGTLPPLRDNKKWHIDDIKYLFK